MISVVVILFITTMVATAPSDIGSVINTDARETLQERKDVVPSKLISVNIPSHVTDEELKYNRMFKAGYGFELDQLPISPFEILAIYPSVSYNSYGLNYFRRNQFPAFYQDKYGFSGNYETKSDTTNVKDVSEDQLRTVSFSTSGSNTPAATPTNPMAPFLNTLIAINNAKILKMFLKNKAMLILG